MVGKKGRPGNVQLSRLKPGLAAAIEAFAATGVPVNLTTATGEALARFAPRASYDGDLTSAIPMKADTLRKRRTRAAHAAYYGATLLVRDRNGEEYVVFPPEAYKDDVNPNDFERHAKRAVFGQFASAADELPRIHAAIEQLAAKVDAALGRTAGFDAVREPEIYKELGRLDERVARLEARATPRRGKAARLDGPPPLPEKAPRESAMAGSESRKRSTTE
jgi:hypothetical protein